MGGSINLVTDPNEPALWTWSECGRVPPADPPLGLALAEPLSGSLGVMVLLQSGHVLQGGANSALAQAFDYVTTPGATCVAPDGEYLADHTASAWRIWHAADGKLVRELPFPAEACGPQLAYSADGQHLFAFGDGASCVVDVQTGEVAARIAAAASSVSWHDEKLLMPFGNQGVTSVTRDGESHITSFAPLGLPRQAPAANEPFDVTVISPAGDRAAVHSRGYGFGLYDAQSGALLSAHQPEVPRTFEPVFSADGAFVLLGDRVLATADASLVVQLEHFSRGFEPAALSNDGKRIGLMRRTADGNEGTALVIDAASGSLLHAVGGHTHPVWSVAVSPDGAHAVTTTGETLLSWKLADSMAESRVDWAADAGHEYNARYSEDGTLVAVSGDEPELFTVDGTSVFRPETLPNQDCKTIQTLAMSPDGRWIARSGFGTIDVFERGSFNLVTQLEVKGCIVSASFSPDSRYLMTSVPELYETDSWTRVWTNELVVEGTPNAYGLTFLPGGREVVSSACAFGTYPGEPHAIVCQARRYSVGGRYTGRMEGLLAWPSTHPNGWLISGNTAMFRDVWMSDALPWEVSASTFIPGADGDILAGTRDGALVRFCRNR